VISASSMRRGGSCGPRISTHSSSASGIEASAHEKARRHVFLRALHMTAYFRKDSSVWLADCHWPWLSRIPLLSAVLQDSSYWIRTALSGSNSSRSASHSAGTDFSTSAASSRSCASGSSALIFSSVVRVRRRSPKLLAARGREAVSPSKPVSSGAVRREGGSGTDARWHAAASASGARDPPCVPVRHASEGAGRWKYFPWPGAAPHCI
jgi:hypothetical protein